MFSFKKSIYLSSVIFFFALCPVILRAQASKENPYIIHSKSGNVRSIDINRKKGTGNDITIRLTNGNAGATYSVMPVDTLNTNWSAIPPPQISDITVMNGLISSVRKNPDNIRYTITTLVQVQFPLRIKIEISDQNLEVEFTEAGNWNMNIVLDNIYNPDRLAAPANR